MRGLMSLFGLLIVLAVENYIYRSYFTGPGDVSMGTGNVRAAADITGVTGDLLGMAQAERAYFALNGRYATLEQLVASGDLTRDRSRGSDGYSYAVRFSERSFTITATYSGPAQMPGLSIDESMQVTQF